LQSASPAFVGTASQFVGLTLGHGVGDTYGVGDGVGKSPQPSVGHGVFVGVGEGDGKHVESTPTSFAWNESNVGQGGHVPPGGAVAAGQAGPRVGVGVGVSVGVEEGDGEGVGVGDGEGVREAVAVTSSSPVAAPRSGTCVTRIPAKTISSNATGNANRSCAGI
jgi:hypothetical protein